MWALALEEPLTSPPCCIAQGLNAESCHIYWPVLISVGMTCSLAIVYDFRIRMELECHSPVFGSPSFSISNWCNIVRNSKSSRRWWYSHSSRRRRASHHLGELGVQGWREKLLVSPSALTTAWAFETSVLACMASWIVCSEGVVSIAVMKGWAASLHIQSLWAHCSWFWEMTYSAHSRCSIASRYVIFACSISGSCWSEERYSFSCWSHFGQLSSGLNEGNRDVVTLRVSIHSFMRDIADPCLFRKKSPWTDG